MPSFTVWVCFILLEVKEISIKCCKKSHIPYKLTLYVRIGLQRCPHCQSDVDESLLLSPVQVASWTPCLHTNSWPDSALGQILGQKGASPSVIQLWTAVVAAHAALFGVFIGAGLLIGWCLFFHFDKSAFYIFYSMHFFMDSACCQEEMRAVKCM